MAAWQWSAEAAGGGGGARWRGRGAWARRGGGRTGTPGAAGQTAGCAASGARPRMPPRCCRNESKDKQSAAGGRRGPHRHVWVLFGPEVDEHENEGGAVEGGHKQGRDEARAQPGQEVKALQTGRGAGGRQAARLRRVRRCTGSEREGRAALGPRPWAGRSQVPAAAPATPPAVCLLPRRGATPVLPASKQAQTRPRTMHAMQPTPTMVMPSAVLCANRADSYAAPYLALRHQKQRGTLRAVWRQAGKGVRERYAGAQAVQRLPAAAVQRQRAARGQALRALTARRAGRASAGRACR